MRAQRCAPPCQSSRPTILSARSAAVGVPALTPAAGGLRPQGGPAGRNQAVQRPTACHQQRQ
ncbi:hypothetical protein E1J61_33695 [Cupriavidus sp. L7L]|nr:hypothetical protein E1J61_33695 [Cupriavidus sp. L7L]